VWDGGDAILLDERAGFLYFALVPNEAGKSTTAVPDAGLPFEEAIKRLESIVETMESGELPLEDLLSRYEEGTGLARHCQSKLTQAELRIQQLEKSANGETSLRPVPLADTAESTLG
jgi:exodeoxyribonuclease VII small subunit